MNDKNKKESVLDTLYDLAGYSLIGIAMEEGRWNDAENGIRNPRYRGSVLASLEELFARKLEAYGTKDLENVLQIAQRMKEKLLRVENLQGGQKILVRRQGPDHAGIHQPKKAGDVGYDLVVSETTTIPPLPAKPVIVPAGVNIKIPAGYWCQIVGRSSAANKLGLLVATATIDEGYTGQLFACTWNLGDKPVTVERGERLGQVVFHKINTFDMEEVAELPKTERGETGFGSTGK